MTAATGNVTSTAAGDATSAVAGDATSAAAGGAAAGGAVLRRPASGPHPTRALLLSGLAGSALVWRPVTERAATGLEIWEAELPWVGGTGWRRDADPARCVAEAVRALPSPPDVLIAHSFAANLVLDLLAREQVDPHPAVVLVSPFFRAAAAQFDWETISYYLNRFHLLIDEGLRVSSGDRLPADLRRAMARQVRERVGPYGWVRFFDLYLGTPFLDTARIRNPTLVITGERDFAAGAADGRALASAVPGARFALLPDSGHFPMAEQPDLFAGLLHDFLDSLPSTPPRVLPTTFRS